jgi:hypothetical protein
MQLQFGGTLGTNAADIWTCGLKYLFADEAHVPSVQEQQSIADAIAPAVQTWFTTAGTGISQDAFLNYIKANWINSDGLQPNPNTVRHDYAAPVPGGIAAQVSWSQTYALTLRTGLHRGRAHSGRIFPPLVVFPPDAGTPYTVVLNSTNMANAGAKLINDINTAISALPTGIGHVAILSPGNSARVVGGSTPAPTTPTSQIVTGVVCDRVPDVQHRRTDKVKRLEGITAPVA